MILQNKDEANKIFIDESLLNNEDFIIEKLNTNNVIIKKENGDNFNIYFEEEPFTADCINYIEYLPNLDYLKMYHSCNSILMKQIKDNEIVSISVLSNTIKINVFKLPMFLCDEGMSDHYPKFDINVSDCMYNMKIYLNESEYIDVPYTKTHNNITVTLNHIKDVVFYLTEGDPEFINKLCNNEKIQITIYEKDRTCKGCNTYQYKISSNGVVLIDETFENGVCIVEWQKFFRLIIDQTWEVEFINE